MSFPHSMGGRPIGITAGWVVQPAGWVPVDLSKDVTMPLGVGVAAKQERVITGILVSVAPASAKPLLVSFDRGTTSFAVNPGQTIAIPCYLEWCQNSLAVSGDAGNATYTMLAFERV